MGINLLPQELRPKGYVLKLSKSLKRLVIFGLTIFLITAFVIIGLFVTSSLKMNSLQAEHTKLASKVKSLEKSEQKYILIKDRIGKIDKIRKTTSANEETDVLKDVSDNLPGAVQIIGADVNDKYAGITINAANSTDISQFFAQLITQGYSSINLHSLEYDTKKGYLVMVELLPKKL